MFVNFYRIQFYSSPPHWTLKERPKEASLEQDSKEGILQSKVSVTPYYMTLIWCRPFMVEVDISEIGAVLSLHFGEKKHSVAFFSRKLSPRKYNYYISGNQESLSVKLMLEEWRHWLECTAHPFTVLTDCKNLEYLHIAKRLNPQWHNGCYNYNLSYCSRSNNM